MEESTTIHEVGTAAVSSNGVHAQLPRQKQVLGDKVGKDRYEVMMSQIPLSI